jgi:ATP-dependent Lon protease
VIIPEENKKDLADIAVEVTKDLDIRPVRWIDEVLDIALSERPLPVEKVGEPAESTAATGTEDGARGGLVRH